MNKQPLKVEVSFYDRKVSTEINHSDVKLEELHELWESVVKAMGYHEDTIREFYGE